MKIIRQYTDKNGYVCREIEKGGRILTDIVSGRQNLRKITALDRFRMVDGLDALMHEAEEAGNYFDN